MPSTSIFHGRTQETYLSKSATGTATYTLTTDEARYTSIEFTGVAIASTIVFPVGTEDAGLRWQLYHNAGTAGTITISANPSGATLILPVGNRVTVVWTGSAWAFVNAAGSTVDASLAGVPENGTTDASDALATLIATGANVRLTRGVTYLVSRQLNLNAGQVIFGNGATLKRAAQVSTTTATSIASGVTTSITVADASAFRVGMSINVLNGSTYDASNRVILTIVGNVITTSTTWGVTVSGTSTVYASYYVLSTIAADCRIQDLLIDGNKSNWTFYRWEATKEIYLGASGCLIDHCKSNNAPGEGFYLNGDYARVTASEVTNANGNGMHLSGCAHPYVAGNRFYNCNLDTAVGHADGLVTWSNSITDATMVDNILDTTTLSGFASIDTAGNSDITIKGNTIRSCTTSPFSMNHADTGAADVIFANNRCYTCGPVLIKDTVSAEAAPASRVFILGNYFKDTLLIIQRSQDVLIEGNILDNLASTTSVLLLINNSQWVTIRGNDLIGGGYGVYIDQPGGSIVTKSIMVEGNNFRMQRTSGVREAVASLTNIVIANNVISNDGTADAANYDGILARDGCHVSGNSIEITAGHAGIYANSGAIVEHNVVRKGAATSSIRADGGTTGVIIRDNLVTTAVSDVGDGLHTSGNITIA